MRLDLYLFLHHYTSSRSKARELILSGSVFVNKVLVSKVAYEVNDGDFISIIDNEIEKYVSRGGRKLDKALEYFSIQISGKTVLDIGASTGGFTDCCLQHGAKFVYALDVGNDQLSPILKKNQQVKSLENFNFKDATKEMFPDVDFIVSDVSFISIRTILLKIKELFTNLEMVILFKPQFETTHHNKKGVVTSKKMHYQLISDFFNFLSEQQFSVLGFTFSPIIGHHEGNIEYLFYLSQKEKVSPCISYQKVVDQAFITLLEEKTC